MATVAEIVDAIDRLAPFGLAEGWDNVGLLLGDAGRNVRRLLVSLDVTDAVCDEADRLGAEALLAHHPLLFGQVTRLTSETPMGRLALRLAGAGRAVIAAHTNLDSAAGGLCDLLAQMAGLEDLEPLHAAPAGKRYKVVVFVPEADLEAVRSAAFAAGAGHIGRYGECGFSVEGSGTFRPDEGASPAVGQHGRRNAVREHRLEFASDDRSLGAVLAAVGRAHSYEEPAVDVYALRVPKVGLGIGRVGRLNPPKKLGALADETKAALGLAAIACAGDPERIIERAAVVSGGGGGLGDAVADAGCQAYLTGELKYHEVEALTARGVAVILGGHYRTERVPLEAWAPRLAGELDVEVLLSESEREPLATR